MASTTLLNLPADSALSGAEWVWINLGGVDYRTTTGQIAALSGGGSGGLATIYVTASGLQLATGVVYSVNTSLGAFSGTLPPLSSVKDGAFLEVQDVAYNAGTNNYTVNAAPGDGNAIAAFGTNTASFALTINDSIVRFTKYGSLWRVIAYGV